MELDSQYNRVNRVRKNPFLKKTSIRLTTDASEDLVKLPDKWSPTYHYSKSLKEIKNQPTPARQFRNYYITYGRADNRLKVLCSKIDYNYKLCNWLATSMQSKFRGFQGE